MAAFYIMRAAHIAATPRKVSIDRIIKEEPNCTIIVATRHRSWDQLIPVFIIGSPSDYNVKAGDTTSYTVDTGNGYRERDRKLDIHHIIQVKDGAVITIDGSESGTIDSAFSTAHSFAMK